VEVAALEGTGMVALSVASKPLALTVSPELPVSVPAASIITWSGALTPHAIEDQQVYAAMGSSHAPSTLLQLSGSGRLLVEQTFS
jgi:uncharacterized protein (AIM24 family)